MLAGLVHPIDQLAFVIGLPKEQVQTKTRTYPVTALLYPGERLVAVEVRFALPQQVEVGAVQDIDALQVFSDRSRASAAACYTLIITSYHMLINLLSYYY
jgi:hypothetical protein